MQVKQRLGGHVRLILSGAAPLAPHVEDFLKVTMCAPVVQGYGERASRDGFWFQFEADGCFWLLGLCLATTGSKLLQVAGERT